MGFFKNQAALAQPNQPNQPNQLNQPNPASPGKKMSLNSVSKYKPKYGAQGEEPAKDLDQQGRGKEEYGALFNTPDEELYDYGYYDNIGDVIAGHKGNSDGQYMGLVNFTEELMDNPAALRALESVYPDTFADWNKKENAIANKSTYHSGTSPLEESKEWSNEDRMDEYKDAIYAAIKRLYNEGDQKTLHNFSKFLRTNAAEDYAGAQKRAKLGIEDLGND